MQEKLLQQLARNMNPQHELVEVIMKNLTWQATALATVLLGYSAQAENMYSFVAGDGAKETKLCVLAAEGDLSKTKAYMRNLREYSRPSYTTSSKLNTRTKVVSASIFCNNMNLIDFIARYNPGSETFDYFNEKGYPDYRLTVDIVDDRISKFRQKSKQIQSPQLVVITSR